MPSADRAGPAAPPCSVEAEVAWLNHKLDELMRQPGLLRLGVLTLLSSDAASHGHMDMDGGGLATSFQRWPAKTYQVEIWRSGENGATASRLQEGGPCAEEGNYKTSHANSIKFSRDVDRAANKHCEALCDSFCAKPIKFHQT